MRSCTLATCSANRKSKTKLETASKSRAMIAFRVCLFACLFIGKLEPSKARLQKPTCFVCCKFKQKRAFAVELISRRTTSDFRSLKRQAAKQSLSKPKQRPIQTNKQMCLRPAFCCRKSFVDFAKKIKPTKDVCENIRNMQTAFFRATLQLAV